MFALLLLSLLSEVPQPEALVRQAMAAKEAQQSKNWQFTWREDEEQRPLNGAVRASTYDVIMLEGETYRKKILVNGQPLDAKEQQRVDEDLAKTRAERQKRGRRAFTRTVSFGGLEELIPLFDLRLAGEETVGGRPAWKVIAEPKPNLKPKTPKETAALNSRRTLWFCQKEGVELQRLDQFLRATNGFQPGSEIEMQFGKMGEAWLIERLILRYRLKAMAVVRGQGETHYRYSNYQRFTAESTLIP
ncbi:MAG: hypothetical protein K2X03_00340 [Bryobacteraceae bacterium]|nr:hypothetical protein [Bryobacteraceae bacterium]